MRLVSRIIISIVMCAAFSAAAHVQLSERNRVMPVTQLFEAASPQQLSELLNLTSENQALGFGEPFSPRNLILINNTNTPRKWTLTSTSPLMSNGFIFQNGAITKVTSNIIHWPLYIQQQQQLTIPPQQQVQLIYNGLSPMPTQLWSSEWLTQKRSHFAQITTLALGAIVSLLLVQLVMIFLAQSHQIWSLLTQLFFALTLACALGLFESLSSPLAMGSLQDLFFTLAMISLIKAKQAQNKHTSIPQSATLTFLITSISCVLLLTLPISQQLLPSIGRVLPLCLALSSTSLIICCCYALVRHADIHNICHLGISLFIGLFFIQQQFSISLSDKMWLYLPVIGTCALGFISAQRHAINMAMTQKVSLESLSNLGVKYKELEIDHRLLQEKNAIDFLTGLKNRQFFDERYHAELARSARENTPLSLILIDLDYFKAVNDSYGHQIGDEVLKAVAKRFYFALKRPADAICRYGGEEFVILLPNTHIQGASHIAEQISHAVNSKTILTTHGEIGITISQGVSTLSHQANLDERCLLTMADEALYRAKSLGRNRFEVSVKKPFVVTGQAS